MFESTFYTISIILVVSSNVISCAGITTENSDPTQCGPLNFKRDIKDELSFPDGKFMNNIIFSINVQGVKAISGKKFKLIF